MAYFEYDYVNTGYDTDSALPPVQSEYNVICNFVYSTKDIISQKIIDFNYNMAGGVAEEAILNLKYNVYSELSFKIANFSNNIHGTNLSSVIDLYSNIDLPVFRYAIININYNIGEFEEPTLFVLRKNEND